MAAFVIFSTSIMVLCEIHQRFKGHFLNELRVSFNEVLYYFTTYFFPSKTLIIVFRRIHHTKGSFLQKGYLPNFYSNFPCNFNRTPFFILNNSVLFHLSTTDKLLGMNGSCWIVLHSEFFVFFKAEGNSLGQILFHYI